LLRELTPNAISVGAAPLGVTLGTTQAHRLADFAALLLRWNAVHNLTAIRAGEDFLTHHLLDSLALAPFVLRAGGSGARVLDLGSGGGLPGIVLAIALPGASFTLVDAVRKKCAFLTQARLDLGLENVEVVHGRVERLQAAPFDVVVSRALTTLTQFVAWTRHLLMPQGRWLAMKGRRPDEELARLPPDIMAAVTALQVPGLDEQRHVIEMRKT
jgi:16S rRNA (guanine527-N7)-methyltransferase